MASYDHTNAQNIDKNEIFQNVSQKEALFMISLGLERTKILQWKKMHCLQQTELRERSRERHCVHRSQNPQES